MEIFFSLAFSMHLNLSSNFNEVHPHIRIENNNNIFGLYQNSNDDLAVYSGWKIGEKYYVDLGVTFWESVKGGWIHPWFRGGYKINDHINIFTSPVVSYDENNQSEVGGLIGIEFTL